MADEELTARFRRLFPDGVTPEAIAALCDRIAENMTDEDIRELAADVKPVTCDCCGKTMFTLTVENRHDDVVVYAGSYEVVWPGGSRVMVEGLFCSAECVQQGRPA